MCLRSNRYDREITLLQLDSVGPNEQVEEVTTDVSDRFVSSGQAEA
jgi:hypothetical protein